MIRAIILEDEKLAANKLIRLLSKPPQRVKVIKQLHSLEASILYLKKYINTVDLIFLDIHLGDGNCFEIFEHLEIETPIVFTTAYNQYAIQAFQQNSVDYLLKPITQETLNKAVSKFEKYFLNSAKPEIDYQRLASQIQSGSTSRNRFIVYVGAKIYSIHIDEIAYFFSEQGNTFLKCLNGNTYSINYSLEKLINSLDLALFYRVNRKMIVHIQAIKSAYQYSKSKLKVELNPDSNFDVFVPLDKVVSFKEWLGK